MNPNNNINTEIDFVIDNAVAYANLLTAGPRDVWIFDVDETSLSGFQYMSSIDFGWVAKLESAWIQSASATAIPQTLQFYEFLLSKGFQVIFLTGRHDTECAATIKNLQLTGYTNFLNVICRDPSEYNLSAEQYKTARRAQIAQDYRIIGCIGDQYSDILGANTGFKIKLPNQIYFIA